MNSYEGYYQVSRKYFCRKYFCRKYFRRKYFRRKYFRRKYFLFSIFFSIFFLLVVGKFFVLSHRLEAQRIPSSLGAVAALLAPPLNRLPVATPMTIPPALLQQYILSPQRLLYPDPLNFLIHHYAVAASLPDGRDTYYIPLQQKIASDNYEDLDEEEYFEGEDESWFEKRKEQRQKRKEQRAAQQTVMVPVDSLMLKREGGGDGKSRAQQAAPRAQAPRAQQLKNLSPLFETTAEVDVSQTPKVPPLKSPEELKLTKSSNKVNCKNSLDHQTEAQATCVDCVLQEEGPKMRDFLHIIDKTSKSYGRNKNFSAVKKNFCNSCYATDMGNFVNYIEERAQEEQVPSEIMLAIMLRESNGKCDAQRKEKNGSSYGLFQLYTANSTKLKDCDKGELNSLSGQTMKQVCRDSRKYQPGKSPRTDPRATGVCLDNPYCNFEEALHLLRNQKWPRENKGSPSGKAWTEMDSKERNKWRNAIIAYNGAYYMRKAEETMKEKNLGSSLDNWELKRLYFIRHQLNPKRSAHKEGSIHNLAYVERLTGRETKAGISSSSICEWIEFRKNNKNLSCSK